MLEDYKEKYLVDNIILDEALKYLKTPELDPRIGRRLLNELNLPQEITDQWLKSTSICRK